MKIKVIMNWNNNKEVVIQVPEDWSGSQIKAAIEKKWGIYDILRWEAITV